MDIELQGLADGLHRDGIDGGMAVVGELAHDAESVFAEHFHFGNIFRSSSVFVQ